MNFLVRNIAVFHVFLVVAAFSWIFGGTRSDMLIPVMPWVYALLLEGMLFFPQHRSDETILDARERVWRGLARDPLTYLSLAFVALLVFAIFNTGLCPVCDRTAIAGGASPDPAVPFAPFCVNARDHLSVLVWFVPALTAMLAAKHALLKRGKRLLLEMLVWNGAALAVLGFVQQATGAEAPYWTVIENPSYFFSAWGYPNMAGDFFTFLFAVSVGLWQLRIQEIAALPPPHEFDSFKQPKHKWLRANYLLIAAVLNFFAALDTLSRAAILLVGVLLVVMFCHIFFGYFTKLNRLARVKMSACAFLGLVFIVISIVVFAPPDLRTEAGTITPTAVLERVSGKGQYHVRVSWAIFKDHPLFGVGGWGYKHFCIAYMTPEELKNIQMVGGINVHNDYLQFLCEHGVVGAGLLLAILVLLLYPLARAWHRLYRYALFAPPDQTPAKPFALYCLPSPVFGVLLAATATLVHAFGDCPLRSPACLSIFLVSLACAEGFLPRDA